LSDSYDTAGFLNLFSKLYIESQLPVGWCSVVYPAVNYTRSTLPFVYLATS